MLTSAVQGIIRRTGLSRVAVMDKEWTSLALKLKVQFDEPRSFAQKKRRRNV
ncbi:MAG: hypothetical protein LBI10_05680 [Deltaproteobacteria bacterium]|nr:hypothetical protein [Deltaproteobacteria bacterium]